MSVIAAEYEDAHLVAVKIPVHSASSAVLQKSIVIPAGINFPVLSLNTNPMPVALYGEVSAMSKLSLKQDIGSPVQRLLF